MSRSFLFVKGDGTFRHMIIDESDAAANTLSGETLEEAPAGSQPAPGRQIFAGGELQEQ